MRDVIRRTSKHGIATFGYFMVGNPYETEASIQQDHPPVARG